MGWRTCYDALLELFPQVDVRLIKGAALEHGDDVTGAAEFIINEVLEPNENTFVTRGQIETLCDRGKTIQGDAESAKGKVSEGSPATGLAWLDDLNAEEARVVPLHESRELLSEAGPSGVGFLVSCTTGCDPNSEGVLHAVERHRLTGGDEQLRDSSNGDGRGISETVTRSTFPGQSDKSSKLMQMPEEERGVQRPEPDVPQDRFGSSETSHSALFEHGHVGQSIERKTVAGTAHSDGTLKISILDNETNEAGISTFSSAMDRFPGSIDDGRRQDGAGGDISRKGCLPDGAAEGPFPSASCYEIVPDTGGVTITTRNLESVPQDMQSTPASFSTTTFEDVLVADIPIGPSKSSEIQESKTGRSEGAELVENADSVYGMIESGCVSRAPLTEGVLDAKSFMSVNSMDTADWENVHTGSIRSIRVELLNELVEDAKSEKEDLINAIEEIRVLRIRTDQAECVARAAKEEAARGGAELFSKVEEMRQLLSKAREANAVHAGEVCGEKAVLATEARELQMRLTKVREEKVKALSALNEIKSFLEARFESAKREHEASKLEKVSKEASAREALAIEEGLVAKVAQESRDLEAESDACNKLREFLVDRGATVDALQGEVAVLWEDAEALKKDLDGLSSSCSGAYVHMLSRQCSDIFKNLGSNVLYNSRADISRLSASADVLRPDLQSYEQSYPTVGDCGLVFHNGMSEVPDQAGGFSLKSGIDKKSWSSIPSLIGALSGSQDLTSSSHSAQSYKSSSSKNSAVTPSTTSSANFGAEGLTGTTASPAIHLKARADDSPQVSEVRMAMFPGEEIDPEYTGNHTLDIFREEKAEDSDSGPADDWHLIDDSALRKPYSSSSATSSCASK